MCTLVLDQCETQPSGERRCLKCEIVIVELNREKI